MGSGWALGCTALKSALNVHLVAGLVWSYLEEMILLKEDEYRNQSSALSEYSGDKCPHRDYIPLLCISVSLTNPS